MRAKRACDVGVIRGTFPVSPPRECVNRKSMKSGNVCSAVGALDNCFQISSSTPRARLGTMSAMDVDPRDGPGEPSTSFPRDLFELASDVAMVGAPPSDAVASQIFQMHPLPDVFAAIGEADEGSKREGDLCSFLDRMFQTGPGKAMLASAMPYARAGVQADSPRVRQLACAQLGRAAQQVVAAAPDELAGYLTSLVDAVGDEDSGVAAAAADALLAVSTTSASVGEQILTRVSTSTQNERRAEPRLRRHALAAAIAAGAGAGDAAALTRALLLELDSPNDPLASVATMELVAEIVENTPRSKVALALCDATLPRLAAVAAAEPRDDENDAAAGFARARAATVGARIASAASTARGSFPHATGGDALLDALASLLARAVQGEGDRELGEVACAAVTSLAESTTAIAALCARKDDRKEILSRVVHLGLGGSRVSTGTRVAALHAVATFAGAGDQTGRRSRLAAPAMPHEPACGSAADAETAETAVRDAAYDAAAAISHFAACFLGTSVMVPAFEMIQLAWRVWMSSLAVSGESLPAPSAFFTGAKSRARSPWTTQTESAYLYVSKMKASSLIPFGAVGETVSPVSTSK